MQARSSVYRYVSAATTMTAAMMLGCGGGQQEEACSVETRGTLEVTIYGEPFIEEKIPTGVFVDGWEVTFDKFLVHLRQK